MLSLTGYGVGTATLGQGQLRAELRGVNHRFLDIKVRLPTLLSDQAAVVDEVIRERLVRGRIEVTIRMEGGGAGYGELDLERARAAFRGLARLRDEMAPDQALPLSLLAAVPDLFGDAARPDPAEAVSALRGALLQACEGLLAMRAAEGGKLMDDFRLRLDAVEALIERILPSTARIVSEYRDRLRARIEKLVGGSVDLDPGRLEHEVALFADRGDVTEELTRLGSHCAQARSLLQQGAAPVGRKLEFLLQEMGREVNTTGSKIADLDVTHLVLELKAELERMREQVQNVL